jgi:TfoX/Sxy family transcriptional regulator of competence genes
MAWQKSSPELVERFGRVLDRFPDVERRKMFGYPAGFVGGNMVTSLFEESCVVRLDAAGLDDARAAGATAFDPMGGRPMKNYATLPASVMQDDEAIAGWVERAVEHGRSMPIKAKS